MKNSKAPDLCQISFSSSFFKRNSFIRFKAKHLRKHLVVKQHKDLTARKFPVSKKLF